MKGNTPVVLLVDRDTPESQGLARALKKHGYDVVHAHDTEAALRALEGTRPDGLVTELGGRSFDGTVLLARALRARPDTCAVVIADHAPADMAADLLRAGAADVLARPVPLARLLAVLDQGFARQALARRALELETRLDERFGFERFTGHGPALTHLIEQARQAARGGGPVLLVGEPGTGKALLAQVIHQNSLRAKESFVRVQVPALGETALEGELFGERGHVAAVEVGTLFLDEIGELPSGIQDKLLRLLQNQEFEPSGRSKARLMAATAHDLDALVAAGRFRRDLHEFLRVGEVRVPPLRERLEEVPLLVDQFLKEFNREHARRVTGITRGALEQLLTYGWPGNVRELRNAIEGMVVFAEGRRPIDVSDLPQAVRNATREDRREVTLAIGLSLAEVEKRFMEETLRAVSYDRPRAAEMLGIGLRTLYRKLKEYEIG